MKRLSVKWKLTLLITALLLVLTVAMAVFLMTITNRVVTENACTQLETTVRANLTLISRADDGNLLLEEGFAFTRSGVYTLIYSESGALLAGQPPLSAPDDVEFENGALRSEEAENDSDYYVLDFWLPFSWDDGVWVRGLIQVPEAASVVADLSDMALLVLPLVILLGGAGAYILVRSAFRPMDQIVAAAEAIGEGRDLSRRIGLGRRGDEMGRLAQAFDSMFARLEHSFEAEKQFTSDASHELRTPISVILAQCGEARHAETAEQYQEAITVIDRQARKMSALVAQLLQMTRLEQGTLRAAMEEADLSELVEVLCREQPELPKGITIQADVQPEVHAVFDVTLMSRLLQNLLDNAARYGRENGHIWVTLRTLEDQIFLSVRDDGVGIPEDRLEKIFQRFYQVDPARSGSAGTGLGLTMVRQIARLHGGEVTVESHEGVGSCFTFRFPAHHSGSTENDLKIS